MILKSLSRRLGATGQLVQYIFKDQLKAGLLVDPLRQKYVDMFEEAGVTYTERDIEIIINEELDAELYHKIKDMTKEDSWDYFQNEFKTRDYIVQLNKLKKQNIIKHNIRSSSIDGFIEEFKENDASRIYKRKDQSVGHVVLSWGDKDREHLTDEMIHDLTGEYIRLRGESNLYLGTIHKELDHVHAHLLVSSTQLNGKSSRISKQRFQEIKIELQQYQQEKYPELTNSLPKHKHINEERTQESVFQNIKNERAPLKQQLLDCLESFTPKSQEELMNRLEREGFSQYDRRGKLAGLQHESGYKFRFSRLPIDFEKLQEQEKENDQNKNDNKLDTLSELRDLRSRGDEGRDIER